MRILILMLLSLIHFSCSKSTESSTAGKIAGGSIQVVYPKNGAVYKGGETFCYRADFFANTIKSASARIIGLDNKNLLVNIESNPNTSRFTIDEEWVLPKQMNGKLLLEFTLTDEKGKSSQSSILVQVDSVE